MDLRLSNDARLLLADIDPRRREQVAGAALQIAAQHGARQIQRTHVDTAARRT